MGGPDGEDEQRGEDGPGRGVPCKRPVGEGLVRGEGRAGGDDVRLAPQAPRGAGVRACSRVRGGRAVRGPAAGRRTDRVPRRRRGAGPAERLRRGRRRSGDEGVSVKTAACYTLSV